MSKLSNTDRVIACRERLKEFEIKNPKHFFSLIYREYKKDKTRLDNLYYCNVEDEDFTDKLEIFTLKMEQTFKK